MTEKENVFEIESSELKCNVNAITTNREETERERDDVLFFSKVGTQKTLLFGRRTKKNRSKIQNRLSSSERARKHTSKHTKNVPVCNAPPGTSGAKCLFKITSSGSGGFKLLRTDAYRIFESGRPSRNAFTFCSRTKFSSSSWE